MVKKVKRAKTKGSSPPIERILVPIDFPSYSDHSTDYAATIAEKFGAEIILMHVIESLSFSVTDTLNVVEHRQALETIARSLLDNLSKILLEKHLAVKTYLVSGSPSREILDKAQQDKADLIVMGTHGRTGMGHLLLGSVAEKVVRLSTCPVLTVQLSPAAKKNVPPLRPLVQLGAMMGGKNTRKREDS